jgi:predicted AlkP superfamily pyrophosphatase or phosphodiesterase
MLRHPLPPATDTPMIPKTRMVTARLSAGVSSWRIALVVLWLLAAGCAQSPQPELPPGPAPAPDGKTSGGTNDPRHASAPHVVLISFDGFKPEYLDRFDLPNFRRAMARGIRATLTPVFPSLTFPNHVSLVTGRFADRHGIVANSFYDPQRDQSYSLSDSVAVSDGTWYRGEPVWVTAERQGMVAACYFWPGSEAAIGGIRPTIATKYASSVPNEARVQAVLEWLARPADTRPHLITLYFSELDSVSHRASLDSPDIERAAQSLDRSLGQLMDGIAALPIAERVYLVLTSDHGMVETGVDQTVRIESLLDLTGVRVAFSGPVTSLHTGGDADRARATRNRLNAKLRHGRAYLRHELPERFHYRSDPRAGDVVVVMDEGWLLHSVDARPSADRYGMHGWDPALRSMKALFLVTGPTIRAGVSVPEVRNVDVYPFLTELLGLTPAIGIDGQAGVIAKQVQAR